MNKRFLTILVVLFTVGLAGFAIFTAVTLYQQRQQPVAPTTPTSIPRAQTLPTTSCDPYTFSITSPVCGDTCSPSDPNSCPQDHKCNTTTNKCELTACTQSGASCDANKCTVTTTPPPPPGEPQCGDTCSPSDPKSCPEDHTCSSTTSKCVLTACTQAGTTCDSNKCNLTTAPKCGDSCTNNSQCPTNHSCNGVKCILADCLTSGTTCNSTKCAVVEAPPELPTAGVSTPTILAIGLALLAIIGALLLAMS